MLCQPSYRTATRGSSSCPALAAPHGAEGGWQALLGHHSGCWEGRAWHGGRSAGRAPTPSRRHPLASLPSRCHLRRWGVLGWLSRGGVWHSSRTNSQCLATQIARHKQNKLKQLSPAPSHAEPALRGNGASPGEGETELSICSGRRRGRVALCPASSLSVSHLKVVSAERLGSC